MKLTEAIKRADMFRPNAIPPESKTGWIAELDGRIAELTELEPPIYQYPRDDELLAPYPWDALYEKYLAARIDLYLEESDRYANDQAVFEAEYKSFRAWWRRNHCPTRRGNWRIF